MEENNQSGLFEIRLNETGKFHIRKLSKIASVIYFFMVVESMLFLFTGIRGIIRNSTLEVADKWEYFRLSFYPYFSVVTTIGNLYGVYYYMKFFKRLNQSINGNDEVMFNQSFKYIFRNAIMFFVLICLNLVSAVFFIIKY